MQYDEVTGEVIPRFNSMYGPGVKKTGQDLSRTKEPVYTEVPPYAVDEEGNFLNKTSFPMLVQTGEVDVQERIQSYADECDIYKILERFALSGCTDTSIINRVQGSFGDICDIPDNIHDFDLYVGGKLEELKKYDPSLVKLILSEDTSETALQQAINDYIVQKAKAIEPKVTEKKDEVQTK